MCGNLFVGYCFSVAVVTRDIVSPCLVNGLVLALRKAYLFDVEEWKRDVGFLSLSLSLSCFLCAGSKRIQREARNNKTPR